MRRGSSRWRALARKNRYRVEREFLSVAGKGCKRYLEAEKGGFVANLHNAHDESQLDDM